MSLIRKVYLYLLDIVQTLLIAASVFLVIYMFLFRPFQVNGLSMYPTFQNGEYVLTDLITYKFQQPAKGTVIVFIAPTDAEKDFIKRIIAAPRDTIFLKDGDVYVNDIKLDESSYLSSDIKTYPGSFLKENEKFIVPPDHYFVLGDNRPHSSDSREFGPIRKGAIIGKSLIVYWPITAMRMVKSASY